MTTKHIWVVRGEHTMHCAGCVQAVEYALSRLPGVKRVKVDLRTQRIEVEVEGSNISEMAVEELRDLGYEVQGVHDD
jgi:copper chaperone CopZ